MRATRTLFAATLATTTAALAFLTLPAAAEANAPPRWPTPVAVGTRGAAANTAPGSLVYIKDNNVWLSSPDGAVTRQITTDGTPTSYYKRASQADNGTIVAVKGQEILRFDRAGHLLNGIAPLVLQLGIWSAEVSPDGTKIAYETAGLCDDDNGGTRLCYQTDVIWAN